VRRQTYPTDGGKTPAFPIFKKRKWGRGEKRPVRMTSRKTLLRAEDTRTLLQYPAGERKKFMKKKALFNKLIPGLLALMLLLSACDKPGTVPTPTSTLPARTEPPLVPKTGLPTVTLNAQAVSTGNLSEIIPALTENTITGAMPEYIRLTLQGYPIAEHILTPQISVYEVESLGVNEAALQATQNLHDLLRNRQIGEAIPALPLVNARQAMHPQVEFLDFQNGTGVRFLTQYNQGFTPINNRQLCYTFQGLTIDGKYFLSVVLPVNLPGLPPDGRIEELNDPAKLDQYVNNYNKNLAETITLIDQQPAEAFTPDLGLLDALVESIEVK
jgi:hypothetical protein